MLFKSTSFRRLILKFSCCYFVAIIYYLKQWVGPEQFYLLVRCFFSIALQADEFFYLLLVGFFSIRDKFMEHWFTILCAGILEVHANLSLVAVFQLADC